MEYEIYKQVNYFVGTNLASLDSKMKQALWKMLIHLTAFNFVRKSHTKTHPGASNTEIGEGEQVGFGCFSQVKLVSSCKESVHDSQMSKARVYPYHNAVGYCRT